MASRLEVVRFISQEKSFSELEVQALQCGCTSYESNHSGLCQDLEKYVKKYDIEEYVFLSRG